MAACNQFDLLRLGSDNPIVDVVLGKHKVKSITSLETGMGISIGKNYEIINVFTPKNQKKNK